MAARVQDNVQQDSPAAEWSVKVDRTPPALTNSGTLKDANRKRLIDGRDYTLSVDATDQDQTGPRAGVEKVDILLDGQRVDGATQTCPPTTDSCPLADDYVLRPDTLTEGAHEVKVLARDRAGNEVTSETYTVHVGSPGTGERPTYTFEDFELDSGTTLKVNVANGNMLVKADDIEIEADFGFPVDIDRFYNSQADDFLNSLGRGWTTGLGSDVRTQGGDGAVTLMSPSGDPVRFARNTDGSYRAPPGVDAELKRQGDGYVVTYLEQNDKVDFTGPNRAMRAITDEDGNEVSVTYKDNGAVDRIRDTRGRETAFTTNSDGQVTAIQDPDNRRVEYTPGIGGRLDAVTKDGETTRFKYNLRGYLSEITEPDGERTLIDYHEDVEPCQGEVLRLLPAPIGGEGLAHTCKVKSVTRSADSSGSGNKTTFAYAASPERKTTVTNPQTRADVYTYDGTLFVTDSTHGSGAPSLELSGTLAAPGQRLSDSQDYELRAVASAGPGIESTKFFLNDDEVDEAFENCPEECTSDLDKRWLVNGDYFRGGEYIAKVVTDTADGDRRVKQFKFFVGEHTDDHSDRPAPDTEQQRRDKARAYRTTFGLDASESRLDQVLSDPSLAASEEENSTPLTPVEREYVDEGQRLQNLLPQVTRYGRTVAPESYGGVYMDFRDGGSIHVGFTQNAEQHLAALRQIFASPSKLRSYSVQRTLTELDALQARVTADHGELSAEGIDVRSSGANLKDSVLEVGVRALTPEIAAALNDRYGPGVRLVASDPELGAATLYGGVAIAGDRGTCTSAVPAFRGSTPFLLTAGHCAAAKRAQFTRRGKPIGRVSRNRYVSGSSADALAIGEVDRRRVAQRTVYTSRHKRRSVTAVQPLPAVPQDDLGQEVCKMGITSGPTCGAVSAVGQNFAPPDPLGGARMLKNQLVAGMNDPQNPTADMEMCRGDSGGPVFAKEVSKGVRIWGIAASLPGRPKPSRGAAICRAQTGFGHIGYVQRELGVCVKVQRQRKCNVP